MPPKGKRDFGEEGDVGAASGNDSSDKESWGPKDGGNVVKIKHILCEKHGKIMEALEKALALPVSGLDKPLFIVTLVKKKKKCIYYYG
ncbi:peptidyl-prolyl cis-trans isomerase NIMA-interacting 4-like [Myotis myotis]|uniref:peptidyl-prolyl cis-trans isomerase NIMA-interacting 4-like n=1 Tax=Myotis myotis TaxID=51298 RepID=UPI00174CC0DB|nr:peptidyl-prolyl cis-trans isomerase NIMA-interacting 4-like [Myotis myotis]